MRVGEHWEQAYASHEPDQVSWYQAAPALSLELIDALDVRRDSAVLDVGGGSSFLADALVGRGFTDVTVLDVSAAALDAT